MALRIQTVMTLVKTTAGTYGPYTGPSTPSVSGGRIAIPMDGTVQQVGSVILDGTPSDADGGPSFHQWFCWPQSSQEDPGIADGAEFRISNHGSDADSLELWGIRHPSGYEVRARKVDGTLVGTGTTRFSWTDANRYDLRICRTANGARLRIEYGDSLEIDVATAVGSLWPFAKLGTLIVKFDNLAVFNYEDVFRRNAQFLRHPGMHQRHMPPRSQRDGDGDQRD